MNRRLASIAGLLILLALFFAVNIFATAALRSVRVDLTEEKLYTLSEGSRNIAKGIEEPIRLTLYFSQSLSRGRPALQTYGQRVRELLEEYVRASGGQIILEVIDPEPFSEAEDQAVAVGVAGVPLGGGRGNIFFGLVGRNAVDGKEVLPFFDPNQEEFLEYELSRLIYSLANPARPVVGVLSSLPVNGSPPNPMTGQPAQRPWLILAEIGRLFEVETILPTAEGIPDTVDVLLVIHPKLLGEATRCAIDQFVLAGGRALIFIDPLCESDIPPQMQQNPMAALSADRSSNLPKLLSGWGLTMEPGKVACDLEHAQRVNAQSGGRREPMSYVGWLALTEDTMDREDAVTGRLRSINTATAGALRHDGSGEGSQLTWTPLLQTSTESALMDAQRFAFMPDPKTLLNEFVSSGERLVLAGRLSGEATTAFPDGCPMGAADAADDSDTAHLAASVEPINVIVIADVDMLTDQFWVRQETLFGQINLGNRKFADNGDFVINALDNMAGSTDLISVRARGRSNRPFTLVEEIRRESEREYSAEEQRLQEKLKETEDKLAELQSQRPDQGQLILTPEQQAELKRFNEQRVETRKQLRAVQLDLRKGIERLGTKIKFMNIVLMPLLVALAAVGLGVFRIVRRKSIAPSRD